MGSAPQTHVPGAVSAGEGAGCRGAQGAGVGERRGGRKRGAKRGCGGVLSPGPPLPTASQALLAELSALEAECEIQRTCRQQAEAYAAQVGTPPHPPCPHFFGVVSGNLGSAAGTDPAQAASPPCPKPGAAWWGHGGGRVPPGMSAAVLRTKTSIFAPGMGLELAFLVCMETNEKKRQISTIFTNFSCNGRNSLRSVPPAATHLGGGFGISQWGQDPAGALPALGTPGAAPGRAPAATPGPPPRCRRRTRS